MPFAKATYVLAHSFTLSSPQIQKSSSNVTPVCSLWVRSYELLSKLPFVVRVWAIPPTSFSPIFESPLKGADFQGIQCALGVWGVAIAKASVMHRKQNFVEKTHRNFVHKTLWDSILNDSSRKDCLTGV